MRTVLRWTVAVVAVLHGLVHLVGLDRPDAVAWVLASVLMVATGVLLAARVRTWWLVGAVAVVLSQYLVVTAWPEAAAGTVANALVAVAVAYGLAADGPWSLPAEYRRRARAALRGADAPAATERLVTEADLAALPIPVAGYLRATGTVGRPRVRGFRATIHGRIRATADELWMPWTGEQVDTFGEHPHRYFRMDATMRGLPVAVLHTYADGAARMRVRAAGVVPVVDQGGDILLAAETVTVLNDLCVLAPAAILDAPIIWSDVRDRSVVARYATADATVSATLVFDDQHRLVDFVSEDRYRDRADHSGFDRVRWSTPLADYAEFGGRRLSTRGAGRWHPDGSEPPYDYLEFHVDDIAYVPAGAQEPAVADPMAARIGA